VSGKPEVEDGIAIGPLRGKTAAGTEGGDVERGPSALGVDAWVAFTAAITDETNS
jgi:hypothetical protein